MRGKNKRRKAAIVVTGICAAIFAVTALAFCFNDFSLLKRNDPTDAATINVGTGNTTQTAPGSYTFNFSNGVAGEAPVYYVEFAGANGGGGQTIDANGYGATCYGFFCGNQMSASIQGYRGLSSYSGGGYTSVNLNWNTRNGNTGTAYAAGAGGYAYSNRSSLTAAASCRGDWSSGRNEYKKTCAPHASWVEFEARNCWNHSGGYNTSSGPGNVWSNYGNSGTTGGSSYSISETIAIWRDDRGSNLSMYSGQGGNGATGGHGGGYTHSDIDANRAYAYYDDNHNFGTSSSPSYGGYKFGTYRIQNRYVTSGNGGTSSGHSYPKNCVDYNTFGSGNNVGAPVSTDQGSIKLVRLNPTSYPARNNTNIVYDYDGGYHSFVTGTTVSNGLFAYLRTRYIYSTDNGRSWSETVPTRKEPGSTKVIWRYQVIGNGQRMAPRIGVNDGIIYQGVANLVVRGIGNAGTLALNDCDFTGEGRQFVTARPNGASEGAVIYYAIADNPLTGGLYSGNGEEGDPQVVGNEKQSGTVAKGQDSLTWVSDFNLLNKPIKAGTYYIYWYATASAPVKDSAGNVIRPGNTESKVAWKKVTINRVTPEWGPGTLRGTNPVYNGRLQSLFTGAPELLVPNNAGDGFNNVGETQAALVYYGMSEEMNHRNLTYGQTTNLSDLMTKNVGDDKFYLWAKTEATSDLYATDWRCLGKVTESQIQVATIAATGVAINNPDHRDYNGRESTFISGTPITDQEQNIPLNRIDDVGTVTYSRWFVPADELGKTAAEIELATQKISSQNLAEINRAQDAGRYELVISWTGSRNVYAGNTHFQYYTVNKTDHNIDLGNALNLSSSPTIADGGVQLVAGGWLECIMDGNAITTSSDVIDGINNYASFYWSQDGEHAPNLADPDVANAYLDIPSPYPDIAAAFAAQGPIGAPLGTSDMQLLYDYRARKAGTWYLWIKFDHHCNIVTDTMVRYNSSVTINDLPVDQVHLENVIGGLRHNDDLPFDGQMHEIATGDFLYEESTFIYIDPNDVQYNICDGNGNIVGGYTDSDGVVHDGWTKDKSELRVATFGSYYLMVRWGWSNDGGEYHHKNVAMTDETGLRLYFVTNSHPFRITTKTNFKDLTFSGLTLNANSGKIYDNTPLLYTEESPENSLEYAINGFRVKDEYKEFFGILNFALSPLAEVRPSASDYIADIPTATNVGHYYLYLSWTGGENIAGGRKEYDLTQYLEIIQAPQPNVRIDNIVPLSAEERTYTGAPIPLFGYADDSGAPIFWVKDVLNTNEDGSDLYHNFDLLGGNVYYALSTHNTEAPSASDLSWSATLAGATQTRVNWPEGADRSDPNNVAEYYLWVMITGDQNIEDSTYLIGGAKLEMKEAYVEQPPIAKPALSYIENGFQVLINGSPQDVEARNGIKPPVEYMLYKSGDEEPLWVRDNPNYDNNLTNTIGAIASGTYYVFYRGGNDDNHITQIPDLEKYPSVQGIGYPYVIIQIARANANIRVYPASNGAIYNGKPQTFFTKGWAKIPGNDNLELDYAVYDHVVTVKELNDLVWDGKPGSDSEVNDVNLLDKLDEYLKNSGKYATYAETEKLMCTNAGTYTIYFKASYHPDLGDNPLQSVQIEIGRTRITPHSLDFLETSDNPSNTDLYKQYKADDYALVRSKLIFGLNGTDNLTNLSAEIGNAGLVEYGVAKYDPYTMSTIPEPTTAIDDYLSLTARDAGVYYLYYRVWAGDNHLGTGDANLGVEPAWVCFNTGMPVYISQADSSVVDLSWSTENFGPEVRYNGQPRAVVTEGDLVQKIEGRLVTDPVGKIWYALTASPESPGASSVLWKNSYLSATQTNAGGYYLHVKVEESANLTQLIGCVNRNNPAILSKATADDLSISGITVYNQMYNGGPLNMAVGDLQVNTIHVDSRGKKTIITPNVLPGVSGFFQYTTYNNRKPLTNWPTEQGLAAATNAVESGKYYLWVKIPASDNIEEAIVLVNDDPVEITRANEDNIYIVTPTLAEGVEYNGRDHGLIIGEASLALRSGNALTGIRGDAWYYVKQDSSLPRVDAAGWTQRYDAITARDRGVYYVFVKFTANAGSNHTDLKPVLAGQVEITRAGANTLQLGGILYNEPQTFNGGSRQIAYGELTLEIDLGGELVPATGAGVIRYAWSNDSRVLPNVDDADWQTNLQDLTAVNAGEYYLWVWVSGGENIASFRTCYGVDAQFNDHMLIKQATAEVVKLSGVGPYSDHLVYTGAPQQLAKGTLVQKIAGNEVTSGYVAYGLGFGPNKGQEPQTWYSSLDLVTATNATAAGEAYYLWVRVDESPNIAAKTEYICGIVIDRAQANVTEIAGATNLYYYQGDQRLLTNPGVANFGEVVYRLADAGNVHDANDWLSDWREVVGQDAGWYTVYYAVIDNPNWAYFSGSLDVYINPSTAPFMSKPAIENYLIYNEKPQDLIDFGMLLPEAGAQGCRIRFRYADEDPNIWYDYYDANYANESANVAYTWAAPLGKLPGRTETGTYTILYYTTAGNTGNYVDESSQAGFTPHELTVTINRREIIWLARPTPRYGLKNIDADQILLNEGLLSAPNMLGGTIEYTMNKDDPNSWSTDLPKGKGERIFYCWYRVRFDPTNNYFLDGDIRYDKEDADATGIVYTEPQVVQVLMEKLTLSFLGEPQGVTITYDATEQPLVWGGELSTFDLAGVNNVYVDYSFDGSNWLGQNPETHASILPTASQIGEYTIYYRVVYNPDVFEFTGEDHGVLSSMVLAAVIEGNEIRATIEIDENDNYNIGFDQGSYTDDFGAELADVISYRFRRRDAYFTDDAWHPWSEFDKNKIGTYEIQALIEPKDSTNFTTYEQTDNFETFTIAKDLIVNIDVRNKSVQPLLRVWVDLTGNMGYDDSPFKTEYNPLDKDRIVLHGVNSPGNGGKGVIRVKCCNDRYYYLSATLVSDNQKTDRDSDIYISLNEENTDKATLAINSGLDATSDNYTVFIYEVYKISYNANTGMGSLPDGWKWHDVPYELAENNFEKPGLLADGWSKYPSGSGERFRKGAMHYFDNISQVFYAQYAGENEQTVVIRWKVGNYEISSTGVWFDSTQDKDRPVGMTYIMNEQVYLPDISGIPDTVTYGRRITGWHMEPPDDAVHYSWGFIAKREEIVFVAELNNYGADYINIVFTSDGTPVHSNTIANGSDSYMALSGVTANDFKKYDYQKFVDEYKNKVLTATSDDDRVITYELGPARVEEPVTPENPDNRQDGEENNMGATVAMIIIIIIGLIIAIVGLTVYLLLRNRKLKMKMKRFKEDRSV